jgi:23S rRNA maturation mini-RNase III
MNRENLSLNENKKLILEKGQLTEEFDKIWKRNKNHETKLKELNKKIEIYNKVKLSLSGESALDKK